MNPLFQRGDLLLVQSVPPSELRPGDILVFVDPQKGRIVHRLVAQTPEGLITRGDNNPTVDARRVQPREIEGRVVGMVRQGKVLPVPPRPPLGLYALKLRQLLTRLLDPLYHRLARTGLRRPAWGSLLPLRVLWFSHSRGVEGQLWLGRFLIGRKAPQEEKWDLRRPFRLLVDDASLPLAPGKDGHVKPGPPPSSAPSPGRDFLSRDLGQDSPPVKAPVVKDREDAATGQRPTGGDAREFSG